MLELRVAEAREAVHSDVLIEHLGYVLQMCEQLETEQRVWQRSLAITQAIEPLQHRVLLQRLRRDM